MPRKRIHGIFTSRYGVTGDEIHMWIDKPSETYGIEHRILTRLLDVDSTRIRRSIWAGVS
jgi:hypothetical protein